MEEIVRCEFSDGKDDTSVTSFKAWMIGSNATEIKMMCYPGLCLRSGDVNGTN